MHLHFRSDLVGACLPQTLLIFAPCGAKERRVVLTELHREASKTTGGSINKTNVKANPSTTHRHDTPNNKTHIIKFRVTETEKLELENTAKLLHLSLSTLIRRALHSAKIERTVVVAGGGEETLNAVSTLLAQCGKVGGNLNQLARHFNSGGADTEQLRAKLLDELTDLTAFRLNAEKILGELYGNAQAYRL